MVSGRTIAKNAGFMMASQLITWTLAFVVAIFLPRYLGPSTLGEWSIANSIWLLLSVFMTFGMDTYLTKAIARETGEIGDILSLSLIIRIFFGIIAFTGVTIYVSKMNLGNNLMILVYIVGVTYVLGSIGSGLNAVLMGMERMDVLSIIGVFNKITVTVLTLTFVFLKASIYQIAIAALIPALITPIISYYYISTRYKIKPIFNVKKSLSILNESKQYLITTIVLIAYQQIDKLFIATLVDTRTVGWYDTAMSLFSTMMFVPVVIGTVTFPSLSRTHTSDKDKLSELAQRGLDMMFLMGVPIGLGLVVISKPFIYMVYGEQFIPSGPVLAILGFVLIFTYLNTFLGQLLVATDRTGPWNIVMFVAVVLTAPLDFFLVPWTNNLFGNGALGGATAFLFTEAGMVIGAILILPKNMLQWSNVRTAALSLLCGILMTAASWWWRDSMMFLSIIVGGIVYVSTILLFRVVSQRDLQLIQEILTIVLGKLGLKVKNVKNS